MNNTTVHVHAAYRDKVGAAILSILLFILVFLLLIGLSVVFAALCGYFGLALIMASPHFFTLMIGGGLAAMGILVFAFLVKFIFTSTKSDTSHLIEISRADEPEIFAMIDDIVGKVKTSAPKKVYFATNVNAAVFYDSSFWSMFLPVRKNLMIGMGLVHSTTVDELKAILSHEFGHFSQRSMKVGSYVYQVNKIIYNMLYQNDSYVNFAQRIANINGYFSFFVNLAFKVVIGVQWILQKVYKVVNLNYMGLSREMEFHADHVAASVAGTEPCVDSLLRLGLADHCFSKTIDFYNQKIKDGIRTKNMYDNHDHVFRTIGQDAGLPLQHGIPLITKESNQRFETHRVVLKDQWASHPETIERVRALEEHNIPTTESNKQPAVSILTNRARYEEALTELMFAGVQYETEVKNIAAEDFVKEFNDTMRDLPYHELFNHYYDRKDPVIPEQWTVRSNGVEVGQLFSQEMTDLVYESATLENDINTLKEISTSSTDIKTFDYNGTRYKGIDSSALIPVLERDLAKVKKRIEENDTLIYNHFLSLARVKDEGDVFTAAYGDLKNIDELNEAFFAQYMELRKATAFFGEETPFDQIEANLGQVRTLERSFKTLATERLAHPLYAEAYTTEKRESIAPYLQQELTYFTRPSYDEEALKIYYTAMDEIYNVMVTSRSSAKERILNRMVELN